MVYLLPESLSVIQVILAAVHLVASTKSFIIFVLTEWLTKVFAIIIAITVIVAAN